MGGLRNGSFSYKTWTFRELDEDSNRIAAGLLAMGIPRGTRLALLVPMSADFVSLVFALLKAGMVSVLIDPGMGRKNLLRCLAEARPQGFIAVPLAQAIRRLLAGRFPEAKHFVTAGRRWFWGGKTLAELRRIAAEPFACAQTSSDDPAAIIFTTGSTGPPKGVLYPQRIFERQVAEIQSFYGIEAGEIDLPGFPLFGLFNAAMGVTTVIPQMDFTRPAQVDPRKFVAHIRDWKCTQAFGSPALWNTVGRYLEANRIQLPTLRRALSAGAPVPPHVLERIKAAIHPAGDVHTPYGATEALPIASIAASEVLAETAAQSRLGKGTCVGRRFGGMEWRVIRITDEPLATIDQTDELSTGEIGELIVRGPVVTREYVTRTEANALHKIRDGETFWHRMGDVGYLDASATEAHTERFWFCGRKSHRVLTESGTLYTIPCEAIFNQHPRVYRSALVGVGPRGQQRPVLIVEPWPDQRPRNHADETALLSELAALAQSTRHTSGIGDFFILPGLPVDIRHNAKIFREQLAGWAAKRLRL
jgi:acyl-CoA synthetase (AMP-forming)/AMP-acid ligase II